MIEMRCLLLSKQLQFSDKKEGNYFLQKMGKFSKYETCLNQVLTFSTNFLKYHIMECKKIGLYITNRKNWNFIDACYIMSTKMEIISKSQTVLFT